MHEPGTDRLIDDLVSRGGAVRRLERPSRRAAQWLMVAAAASALLVLIAGAEATLWRTVTDWLPCAQLTSAILTAVTAALAAFHMSVPGHDRRWVLLPLAPLGFWLSILLFSCFQDWRVLGPTALHLEVSGACLFAMIAISLPLAGLGFHLIRQAAPLSGMCEGALAALAAAALAAALVQLLFPLERSVLVLLWGFGGSLAIAALGAACGAVWLRTETQTLWPPGRRTSKPL